MLVFITGASSDIGLSICKKFLENGWDVLAHYSKSESRLNALVSQYKESLNLVQMDFSDNDSLEKNLDSIEPLYSKCDALINLAAIYSETPFEKITAKSIKKHIDVNFLPAILLTSRISKYMSEKGWGRILQISSIGVKYGGGSASYSYSLSKFMLEFIPSVYKEWAKSNLLINVLRVGVVDTKFHDLNSSKDIKKRISQIPIGRMAEPAEIAEFCWSLASESNTYITGQVIQISGGE